jgi:hypothetical protein
MPRASNCSTSDRGIPRYEAISSRSSGPWELSSRAQVDGMASMSSRTSSRSHSRIRGRSASNEYRQSQSWHLPWLLQEHSGSEGNLGSVTRTAGIDMVDTRVGCLKKNVEHPGISASVSKRFSRKVKTLQYSETYPVTDTEHIGNLRRATGASLSPKARHHHPPADFSTDRHVTLSEVVAPASRPQKAVVRGAR